MRKLDGIYIKVKQAALKPENKKKIKIGGIVLLIFSLAFGSFFILRDPKKIAADVESGDPYFLIVQGAPEKGSQTWWEWVVVNPTNSNITVTEVRVADNSGFDWGWTADNTNGWPTYGWTDGGAAGYYWSGAGETVAAHSAKVFRSRPKQNSRKSNDPCTMDWDVTVTGYSISTRQTTVVGQDRGSWGGIFYNKPNDTSEQTEGGTYPNGLYAYLDEDSGSQPLEAGTEYTFYVNIHEWADKAIAAGGDLTITVPKEFTSVSVVDKDAFTSSNVSGGGASDWTITGIDAGQIKNDVIHFSFNATTPSSYTTKSNWEFDTRFDGTGGKGEEVHYIIEADVLVQAVAVPNITIDTTGTQISSIDIPSTENYVGGAFTFVRDTGSTNVTQIVISETGC